MVSALSDCLLSHCAQTLPEMEPKVCRREEDVAETTPAWSPEPAASVPRALYLPIASEVLALG